MNYTPKDFHPEKMNALKFLYIFRRKQEIFAQLLSEVDLSDPQDFVKKKPVIKSFEYIQQETGMTDEDLSSAINIGLWIDEYDQLMKMTVEERQDYLDKLDEDIEVPEELMDDVLELHETIYNIIQQKKKDRELFKQICDDNFNTED
jgi:hypothetical protein